MTELRNSEVHLERPEVVALEQQVEDVPLSSIGTPSALHAAYAPGHGESSYGEPWGEARVSIKVHRVTVAGNRLTVTEACRQYVELVEHAVAELK